MQPHKGLRIPQSWNDKTLLLDEPFLTSFVVRQLASAARGRGNLADKSIAKDVLKDSREVRLQSIHVTRNMFACTMLDDVSLLSRTGCPSMA